MDDLAALRTHVTRLVAQLVPGLRTVWNELDLVRGRNEIVSSAPVDLWPGSGADLVRNLGQHPIFCYYRQTRDGEPHAISELTSPIEFRRTDLYHDVYRRVGLEDQLGTTIFHGDRLVELTVDRECWGFSNRDHLVLAMLRPLLVSKYASLRTEARLAALLDAREATSAPVAEGVLVVEPPNRIVDSSPAALGIVQRWFPGTGAVLPTPLADWYAERRTASRAAPPTFVVEHPVAGQLTARLPADRPEVIVLRERSRRGACDIAERWGLSPRQAAVIELVVTGATNTEIAGTLGISSRTVEKHLEQAYERLGVASRSAAAALVGQPQVE